MKNKANIETCATRRNLKKPTLLTEVTIKKEIARNNKRHQLQRACNQLESEIRKEKIEQNPSLKSFLEEEEQKRKVENNRIKQEMKRKGINLEKIFGKSAEARTTEN